MSNGFKNQTANYPLNHLYAGMDIHKETHSACILDCFFQTIWEGNIENNQAGFNQLNKKIKQVAKTKNQRILFGLEDSYGNGLLLATYLARRGYPVKVVNPVLVDRLRKKTTHPEKSDVLDAKGVAEVLIRQGRTDKLPNYSISQSYQTAKGLRELNNDRDYLIKEQTRLKNQLHGLLSLAYGNNYKNIFKNIFSQKALKYFIQNSYDKNMNITNFPYSIDIAVNRIKRKAERLLAIANELKTIQKEQEELVEKTGQQLETMNGCGLVSASVVLAEIKDINRFSNPSALAKYAGLCPRQKSSGKSFHQQKTYSGNRRLNAAIHRIAISQIGRRGNTYAKEYFQRKIDEGKTKKQSLVCLKRRLNNIIYMMLKNKQKYNYQPTLLT